ncbi:hypothetical protein OPT61_g1645 [Boeremia exigua]|uniref:Uncharacterized protein n=1 Tax=Boeremia exigua TaxID=749465 RepID=A0ACC2IPJ8_9PLEO|nr:hypothetical protein OPT61_g1645 [Boeremia exigua]
MAGTVSPRDWSAEALFLLDVLHSRDWRVPRTVFGDAGLLAITVCYSAQRRWRCSPDEGSGIGLVALVPLIFGRELLLWLCVAWVLRLRGSLRTTSVPIRVQSLLQRSADCKGASGRYWHCCLAAARSCQGVPQSALSVPEWCLVRVRIHASRRLDRGTRMQGLMPAAMAPFSRLGLRAEVMYLVFSLEDRGVQEDKMPLRSWYKSESLAAPLPLHSNRYHGRLQDSRHSLELRHYHCPEAPMHQLCRMGSACAFDWQGNRRCHKKKKKTGLSEARSDETVVNGTTLGLIATTPPNSGEWSSATTLAENSAEVVKQSIFGSGPSNTPSTAAIPDATKPREDGLGYDSPDPSTAGTPEIEVEPTAATLPVEEEAIHFRNRKVPRTVSLEMLAKMTVLVDYYGCDEAVDLWVDMWVADVLKTIPVPTTYCRDLILYILISWSCGLDVVFKRMTSVAIQQATEPLRSLGLPIPAWIVDEIDRRRYQAIKAIISALATQLDNYRSAAYVCPTRTKDSFRCGSILFGALTKEMDSARLHSPPLRMPFYGRSVDALCLTVLAMKSATWWHGDGNSHRCNISIAMNSTVNGALAGAGGLEWREK